MNLSIDYRSVLLKNTRQTNYFYLSPQEIATNPAAVSCNDTRLLGDLAPPTVAHNTHIENIVQSLHMYSKAYKMWMRTSFILTLTFIKLFLFCLSSPTWSTSKCRHGSMGYFWYGRRLLSMYLALCCSLEGILKHSGQTLQTPRVGDVLVYTLPRFQSGDCY